MASIIQIKFNNTVKENDLEISIDRKLVSATFTNTSVSIEHSLLTGLHKLRITSKTTKSLVIEDVLINGDSLRKSIWFSYSTGNQGRVHPSITLWGEGVEWTLLFGYPLSHWIAELGARFPDGRVYGDLDERYYIYWPESVDLSDTNFPNVIKDFFRSDYSFTAIPRDTATRQQIPFMKYTRAIEQSLLDNIIKEVKDNFDAIREQVRPEYSVQLVDNIREYGDQYPLADTWIPYWIYLDSPKLQKPLDRRDSSPAVMKLLDHLGVEPHYCFIGILPPGKFIYPHIDITNQYGKETGRTGCTMIYIPLYWPEGNFIKFANVGCLPVEQGPIVINNDSFTHCLVNNSNEYRYVIGIRPTTSITQDCEIVSNY